MSIQPDRIEPVARISVEVKVPVEPQTFAFRDMRKANADVGRSEWRHSFPLRMPGGAN